MRRTLLRAALVCAFLSCARSHAHDTWVQTNTNLIRQGDVIHVDLMLGNHGNEHRDFKLAGKVSLEGSTLEVVDPNGARHDLKPSLVDTGYTPQEGFWTARFGPSVGGLYSVVHSLDRVMSYAPERAIKSAKVYFAAVGSLDQPREQLAGFDRPTGHDLELVPLVNPVWPMGPGMAIKVRLLYKGQPLAGERVSFIPRGAELKSGFDERYERITDANGDATFEPREANHYLIVAHKTDPDAGGMFEGKPYQFTKYSATLVVFVPRVCPCCGG